MKKGLYLFCCVLALLGLSGCTGSGLGDKVAVKALYLEHDERFEARLLVLESTPNADTGQVSEEARCLAGSGDTVYEALEDAERQEARRLFYGQNELLFLGPLLAKQGAFDACRFLAADSSGRPNIAVYTLDAAPGELERCWEKGTEFLADVEQLEQRGLFRTYLYQFGDRENSGVIPALSASGEQVTFSGLILYEDGRPATFWQGAKAQLARLLAGQRDTLELTLEQPRVSFELRAPKLAFAPCFSGDGMELEVFLSGAIQRLVSERGAALPGQGSQLEQDIDRQVQQLLQELADETIGQGNDVFLLGGYLANLSEGAARAALEGDSSRAGLVRSDCLLRMV